MKAYKLFPKNVKGAFVISNVSEYSDYEVKIQRRKARKDGFKTKIDKSTNTLFVYINRMQLL